MSATDPVPGSRQKIVVLLLCCLAALHVFIYSAAFPFFNNVDEHAQFDLVEKYSHGEVPRGAEPLAPESVRYLLLYGSKEYRASTVPPPLWKQPAAVIDASLAIDTPRWQRLINYESSQPPLYFAVVGSWWQVVQRFGVEGAHLLYCLRFLNMLVVAALVWTGYIAARLVFPENPLIRLGVPALLAFLPQSVFYSIQNDLLSPLCFGGLFVCLIKMFQADTLKIGWGAATGLMFAATFLTKMTNLPLLAVAAVIIAFKVRQMVRDGKWREALPALIAMAFCAGVPMEIWMTWSKSAFGDLLGSGVKVRMLGWTVKPFAEWWHHPIFSPSGFWIFFSGNVESFWRGEIVWHRQPLAFASTDLLYILLTVGLPVLAMFPHAARSTVQHRALWTGAGCCAASLVFLGLLSAIYDFHNCIYPSREHPYFTSGRLMLGTLIPFLLLLVCGLDRAMKQLSPRAKAALLVGFIVFMLASEAAADLPAFSSQYNWFHL